VSSHDVVRHAPTLYIRSSAFSTIFPQMLTAHHDRLPSSPKTSGGIYSTGTMTHGIVVDAAEKIVEFLGPNAAALNLGLANRRWNSFVRANDMWLPVLHRVAPFSSVQARTAHADSRLAGSFSSRTNWVRAIATARRHEASLRGTGTAVALRESARAKQTIFSWIAGHLWGSGGGGKKPLRCLVTGCCLAGKRTLIGHMQRMFNGQCTENSLRFATADEQRWDVVLAEGVSVRNVLRTSLFPIDACIVVVDASSAASIADLRDELQQWVLDMSGDAPICFVVNKLDKPGAVSCESVVASLGLDSLGEAVFTPYRKDWGWRSHRGALVYTARSGAVIGTVLKVKRCAEHTINQTLTWIGAASAAAQSTWPPHG
jgi:hypothetical protein